MSASHLGSRKAGRATVQYLAGTGDGGSCERENPCFSKAFQGVLYLSYPGASACTKEGTLCRRKCVSRLDEEDPGCVGNVGDGKEHLPALSLLPGAVTLLYIPCLHSAHSDHQLLKSCCFQSRRLRVVCGTYVLYTPLRRQGEHRWPEVTYLSADYAAAVKRVGRFECWEFTRSAVCARYEQQAVDALLLH